MLKEVGGTFLWARSMDVLFVVTLAFVVSSVVMGHGVLVWRFQRAAEREEARLGAVWGAVSSQLGLRFIDGPRQGEALPGIARIERQIVGQWRGARVKLQRLDRTLPPTVAQLHFTPPLDIPLRITARRGLHLPSGAILTGDARFDARFVVVGFDTMEVARLLTLEVRVAMLALGEHCPDLSITDRGMMWSCFRDMVEGEELKGVMEEMSTLSERLRLASLRSLAGDG